MHFKDAIESKLVCFFAGTPDGPSIADQNESVDTRQAFYSLTKAQIGKHKLSMVDSILVDWLIHFWLIQQSKASVNNTIQWRIYIVKFWTPPRSIFFHFHAVFHEIWPNNRLALFAPFEVGVPSHGEILDPLLSIG